MISSDAPSTTSSATASEPDLALLQHLRDVLPGRYGLDVGANLGNVSAALLDAGYRVIAFEPDPAAYRRLFARFEFESRFRSLQIALGERDGTFHLKTVDVAEEMSRYFEPEYHVYSTLVEHPLPPGLSYGEGIEVRVRSLAGLHEAGELPEDVALVKIDTEGNDLAVLRGAGELRYPAVMAEFWGESHFFSGASYGLLRDLVSHLEPRGYHWHLTIHRLLEEGGGSGSIQASIGPAASDARAWGNAVFFRDRQAFEHARSWCEAELPIVPG